MTAPKKRRRWPWVLGGLAGALVVVAACNANGPQEGVQTGAAPAAPPPVAPIAYAIGQAADVDGLVLTVADLRDGDSTLGETTCVTVTYENTTNVEQSFNTFDWQLRDTDGVEVTTGFTGSRDILGSGNLRPGGRKSGDVCFDDQGAGEPESVVYRGNVFAGNDDLVWRVA